MAQIQSTGITGSLNVIGSITASIGFSGPGIGGGSGGPAVSYITTSNPPGNINPATSGVLWQNVATSELFTCTDNTTNRNEWAGTSGSRLYYARAVSSSLSGSFVSPSIGVVSGSTFSMSITLNDRYGQQLVRTQTPAQIITFTMSNAAQTTVSGALSGSAFFISNQLATANYSGSVTVTASIDGTLVPNFLTFPVNYPKQVYGLGNSAPEFGGVSIVGLATSGGLELVDTNQYWASASMGTGYVMYLTADGKLFGRGRNSNGQLGDGTTTQRLSLTSVSSSAGPWKKVSAGHTHTCAINFNNELYCWGFNSTYQLGDGTATQRNTPVRIGSDANWSNVVVGTNHTIATKTNGTLWSWGYNDYGQLGHGDTSTRTTPTQVGVATDWARPFAGNTVSFVIKTTGTLWATGINQTYQLGLNDTTSRNSFTQVGAATDWRWIFASYDSTYLNTRYVVFGIRGTELHGWGYNNVNALTSASAGSYITTPTALISSIPVNKVTANLYGVYVVDTTGSLWGWRTTDSNGVPVGRSLAYGSTNPLNALDANTSYNLPAAGAVQRISSIYTFDDISATSASVVAVARIITGSSGPVGNPSSVSVTNGTPTTGQFRLNWTNGDNTAETRIQITAGAQIENNYIRPGRNVVWLSPGSATGSSTTARLTHIKNNILGSGGVTSSVFSLCPAAYTQLDNYCDWYGQRTIVYADGNCGETTSTSCALSCGNYSYIGSECFYEDNCGCGTIYVCYDRYSNNNGGPCNNLYALQGDYCSIFTGCCYGC